MTRDRAPQPDAAPARGVRPPAARATDRPAAIAAAQLQRGLGNRVAGRALQRLTYAIRHPTDTDNEWRDIFEDAQRLNRPPLVTSSDAFEHVDHAALSPRERQRLDIVAHGNQEDVGGMDPAGLANHLTTKCKMPLSVQKVVLHSCLSGAPDPRQDRPTFGMTYARQLQDALAAASRFAELRGQKGLAFTASSGKTRVLKAGKSELDYRRALAEARQAGPQAVAAVEAEFLEKAAERYLHPLLHETVTDEEVAMLGGGELEVALEVIGADKPEYQRRVDEVEKRLRWREEETLVPEPLDEELPALPNM